jgi:hypothetical protein
MLTVSVLGKSVKLAVTPLAAVTEMVQGFVPKQPLPDQPSKVEPVLGDALNVTSCP